MVSLSFIYIEGFRTFEPFSLSLSSQYEISFGFNELRITRKEDYLGNLRGNNIIDLNIIAGQNGVGKTSLLTQIAQTVNGGSNTMIHDYTAFLYIYQTEKNSFGYLTSIEGISFNLPAGCSIADLHRHDCEMPVIYYSPFLDFNIVNEPYNRNDQPLIDISLSRTLLDDTDRKSTRTDMLPSVLLHKSKTIERQVNFIQENKDNFEMPFTKPEILYITFHRLQFVEDDISPFSKIIFHKLTDSASAFLRGYPKNRISKTNFSKILFLRNLLSMYFLSVNKNKSQDILHHKYADNISRKIELFQSSKAKDLINLYVEFFTVEDVFGTNIFPGLIDYVFDLIESNLDIHSARHANTDFIIELDSNDQRIPLLLKILNQPGNADSNNKFIVPNLYEFVSFEWRNLSSGERSFLDLFSRFYAAKNKLKDNNQTILIVIDEGENGFHPKWQLLYITFLLGYFKFIYAEHSIQLLLATHSPLVLSDFPKEYVHLFKKENGWTVREESFGTFAQNTSTLLAQEFFLDTALIGQLSKDYIDRLIERIESVKKPYSVRRLNALNKEISVIDEPVIRRLLHNKLDALINDRN